MIHVRRDDSNKPAGFDERGRLLEEGFAVARSGDPRASMAQYWQRVRDRLKEDAEALRHVFSGKCAFCEAQPSHVSSPHVEHYRPKGCQQFEALAFRWDNWLLSCGRCNEKKWMHFPECNGAPCLLDPTIDDPALHLEFVDHHASGVSHRGSETIRLVGLDRSPLEDDRARWLMYINALLLLSLPGGTAGAEPARKEARELLIWSMQTDAPYAAMTRCYLAEKVPRLARPAVPHPWVDIREPSARIKRFLGQQVTLLAEIR